MSFLENLFGSHKTKWFPAPSNHHTSIHSPTQGGALASRAKKARCSLTVRVGHSTFCCGHTGPRPPLAAFTEGRRGVPPPTLLTHPPPNGRG